jgi:beta-lactamase class D
MNFRSLVVLTVAVVIALVASTSHARTKREAPELAALFEREGLTGTFVMLDSVTETLVIANSARAHERFMPASTFKIVNTLIGLDVGAVQNVDEVLPYGGKPQRLKQWEQDMNLRDAIKVSNVPVYQELARRIGLERMREGVRRLGYGNMEIGSVVDRFWLDGPLAISAVEQVEFLHSLADERLPVKKEATTGAKEITLVEKTGAYQLHAKTGWYWPNEGGQQVGWWVGWVERDGKTFPFALNIHITRDADAEKRIPLGRECLRLFGAL